MAALGVLRALYLLTDSFWVGRLGPAPLAAIGGASFGWWIIVLTCELPAIGAHSRVARQVGARRLDAVPHTLASAAVVGVALAALLAALSPAAGLYFDLLGFARGSAELAHGRDYLAACMLGAASLALSAVVGAAFRGLGDTRTALALTAASLVLNAALDPALIWGVGVVPALGVAGAAWATAISNLVGAIAGAALLARRGVAVTRGRPTAALALELSRIGAPISGSGAGFALVYVLLASLISRFGPEHIAGLGVGHRLEGLAYLVCVAFGVAAATMVGQHLGAGDAARARASARAAARLALAAMIPCTLVLFAGAAPLFSLFTDDAATVDAGARYLRIQTAVLVLMALEEVYKGAFTGAARTLGVSIVSFGLTAVRWPAAWLLAVGLGMGIDGVWIAIAASTAVKGALLALLWRRAPL
ncbi:MAG: MATE family efflux transporter [Sandaracinaceae bacterium]|nr:MATE family efflux transporter [Sandaracinaceae bacterium]